MKEALAISFRPRTFSDLVGLEKITKVLAGHWASGRFPKAWLFAGDTGSGKTTIARILSITLQCPHQKQFGQPCMACTMARSDFDITEANASEITGIEKGIGKVAEGSMYAPRPPSKYRVIILDEAQKLSDSGQNLLLKYFEDCPSTSVWIICTTNAAKIIKALRSRCIYYELPPLSQDNVKKLVGRALGQAKADAISLGLPEGLARATDTAKALALVDALFERGTSSPRLVVQSVEKYMAGADPKEAVSAQLEEADVDTLKICRAVRHGKWTEIQGELKEITPDTARRIAQALMGYMASFLCTEKPGKAPAIGAAAIKRLEPVIWADDSIKKALLVSALYDISVAFFGGAK